MTIGKDILSTKDIIKDIVLFHIIYVKYELKEIDKKQELTISYFKADEDINAYNYKYDLKITTKAKATTIILYFIDITENAQKIPLNKLKKLELIKETTSAYRKTNTEIKKNIKNLCKTPLFKRYSEDIAKQYQTTNNLLFEGINNKLYDEKLINKYSVFFEALESYKHRTKNKIIFLIGKSLFYDKNNDAKNFLKETTILNVYEMMIALNICLKTTINASFNYDKLGVWTRLRHIRKKWEQKKTFKILYDRLYLKNLELYKNHAKAKKETLKAMPTKYKQVKEILSSLDKQTS